MEVGKKYNSGYHTWNVVVIYQTPTNVLVKRTTDDYEFLIHKDIQDRWKEVKDPVVRYVHWCKRNSDGEVFTMTDKHPCHTPSFFYSNCQHIKTDRVECDG